MRLIPSRHWVKEAIPAYLCCETTPWASLWVRFYVWLCPECKQEYVSLKRVWDELDQWEIDLPGEGLEDQFTHSFRDKFPSAFQEDREQAPARAGDLLMRLVYTSAILVIGTAIVFSQERIDKDSPHHIAARSQQPLPFSLAQTSSSQPNLPSQDAIYVADSGVTPDTSNRRERAVNTTGRQGSSLLSGEDPALGRGVQVYTTSTGSSPYPTTQPRSNLARMKRTVAINYVPVTGFETLQAAEEDRSY